MKKETDEIKLTKSKLEIIDVLKKSSKPLTSLDIFRQISNRKFSLSTIYRNIKTLLEFEIIVKDIEINGESYYSIVRDEHFHNIVCTVCNRVDKIHYCPIDNKRNAIDENSGYLVTGHLIEYKGICPSCQKNRSSIRASK